MKWDCARRAHEDDGLAAVGTSPRSSWHFFFPLFSSPTPVLFQVAGGWIAGERMPATSVAVCRAFLTTENVLVVPGAVHMPWNPSYEPVPNDVCDKRAKEAIAKLLTVAEKLNVFLNIPIADRASRSRNLCRTTDECPREAAIRCGSRAVHPARKAGYARPREPGGNALR